MQKEPEDYEQVLSSLALDIQKRQTRLSEIRLRERRTTLLLTMYALAFWVAYVGAWYAGLLPQVSGLQVERTVHVALVFVGPIVIQFSRRIVQTWYAKIGNVEEKTLKKLLAQQRSKVEEIKAKTNYYSTKNLIERYDASPAGSPSRPRPGLPQQIPTTPQRPPQVQNIGLAPGQSRPQTPGAPVMGPQDGAASANPQIPTTPPRKQWYDKLADALLGDDEMSVNSAATRYALICQKCFSHNGLVKEDLWEDTQYVCPKCGNFNPSVRSLRVERSTSPSRPETSISQLQRSSRSGPRKSEPLSGSLLQPPSAATGAGRRKSMPAPQAIPLDEESQPMPSVPVHAPLRRSPLSNPISLPDNEEEGDTSLGHPEGQEHAIVMEVDS
ncbi:hypothetical protein EW145_g6654 [Phellinidium pouzarii]|uniref:Endoplasmic reticulum junction formation protein lunapark n=1 Tax=Phellinidium pouzarii TaxID=167371 RepID=A0A4S4KXR8_9AGAM|nr:hypothetical protein EW145_g6654 [Phellinidium pouzarii]